MRTATSTLDAATVAELEAIDTARDEAFADLHLANQRGLTGTDADAVIATFADLDRRIAALHRKAWPRHRGSLIVTLGEAMLVSPSGRSIRLVWKRAA